MTIIATAGAVDANSYATLVEADTYYADRANAEWDALGDTDKEASLIKATAYIEATYTENWKGYRASDPQALGWPRTDVYVDGVLLASDAIPARVRNACIELALRASAGELLADLSQRVKREKVDVLEVEYQPGSDGQARYLFISRLLGPLLRSSSGDGGFSQVRLQRV